MTLVVKRLVERRDDKHVTRWNGRWETAHEIAALWRDAIGFEVTDKALLIKFADCMKNLVLTRDGIIEVRVSDPFPPYAVGLLPQDIFKSYEIAPEGSE